MGLSLEDLIRRGARGLIQKAIEVEVKELLEEYGSVKMLGGQRAVVRNGYPQLTPSGPALKIIDDTKFLGVLRLNLLHELGVIDPVALAFALQLRDVAIDFHDLGLRLALRIQPQYIIRVAGQLDAECGRSRLCGRLLAELKSKLVYDPGGTAGG